MEYLQKTSYYRGLRDESANKELAAELTQSENHLGIQEIFAHLGDKNKSLASDCLAVLYTIGYSKPELIQGYADDFLALLDSKNNRMVWGSMIALANICPLKADYLYQKRERILQSTREGSLITQVWGIKTLAGLAAAKSAYKQELLPILLAYLQECRPIDFATRMETLLPLIGAEEETALAEILKLKCKELKPSQLKKLNALLKKSQLKQCAALVEEQRNAAAQ